MASQYTYIKKKDLDTLMSRTKNIRVRMLENIATPAVQAFGDGQGAGILISLPKSTGGDTYNGYFKATYTGNDITLTAGLFKAGNAFYTTASDTVTATAAGYVCHKTTYSGGYQGAIVFIETADLSSELANGNDITVLYTVEWNSGVTAVNREHSGVVEVTKIS